MVRMYSTRRNKGLIRSKGKDDDLHALQTIVPVGCGSRIIISRDSSGVEHDHGKVGVEGSNPSRGSI